MAQNLEHLSELAFKAAQASSATDGLPGEKPHNPLPSSFDSASSTADLYGYTTTDARNRGEAPTAEHRGAIWNQTPRDPGELSGTPTPTPTASRPLPARTSSNNYESAQAARSEQEAVSRDKPAIDTSAANDSDAVADNPPLGSPSSATWRPTMFRQQSWSKEDQKRSMQERLMTSSEKSKPGYSSKDQDDS